jgi:hypothetical protein
MSTALDTTRAGIVSALQTLCTGLAVDIGATTDVSRVWAIAKRKPAIYVVYNGTTAGPAAQQIGQRLHTPVHQDWIIVILAENLRSSVEAQNTATLGLDALVELVRGIRNVPITQAGASVPLYLFLRGEKPVEESDNPPLGGTVAYICHYQTQPLWV